MRMNKILIITAYCLFNVWLIYALSFHFDWVGIVLVLLTLMITTFITKWGKNG